MKRLATALAIGGLLLGTGSAATAASLTFVGTAGTHQGTVIFEQSGTNLLVTLINTSPFDVLVPTDVLTAMFFDLNGVDALTPTSAVLNGSTVVYDADGQPAGGNVGGEWAYESGLAGAPLGATEGLSSTGLGLFGGSNFGGPNLAGPAAIDGAQYGLLSEGDNLATGNGGVTGSGGMIFNQVLFTLSGLPVGFTLEEGDITNVSFLYGTSLTEAPIVPGDNPTSDNPTATGLSVPPTVPEPASLILLGSGLAGVAMRLRRRKS